MVKVASLAPGKIAAAPSSSSDAAAKTAITSGNSPAWKRSSFWDKLPAAMLETIQLASLVQEGSVRRGWRCGRSPADKTASVWESIVEEITFPRRLGDRKTGKVDDERF